MYVSEALPPRSRTMLPGAMLLLLLVVKFLWRPVVLGQMLGFDAGINRFLFLRYAESFPVIPALEPWAREHAPGLFLLAAPFIKIGVPVDWFLTVIWGLLPVALLLSLGYVTGRRWGKEVGVWTLLMGLLSLPFEDAFAAMYWKTLLALLFTVWAYHFLEHRRAVGWLFLFLTFLTHQQTALLAGLALAIPLLLRLARERNRRAVVTALLFLLACSAALAAYSPAWSEAIRAPFLSVLTLRGAAAPGGAFLPMSHYLALSWPLYVLGLLGLRSDLRAGRLSAWHLSIVVAALFVMLRLVFHRRFFLQLDFFLLPFAAIGCRELWRSSRRPLAHVTLAFLLLLQAWSMIRSSIAPRITVDRALAASIVSLTPHIPRGATLVSLENITATTLRGWLPEDTIRAPGLFGDPWTPAAWEIFIRGTAEERQRMTRTLPPRSFLFVAPAFRAYYGQAADAFLADACFIRTDHPMLLQIADRCLSL